MHTFMHDDGYDQPELVTRVGKILGPEPKDLVLRLSP